MPPRVTVNMTKNTVNQRGEQEAHMQSILNEPEPDAWPQIAPLLDGAMRELMAKINFRVSCFQKHLLAIDSVLMNSNNFSFPIQPCFFSMPK